MDWSRCDRSPRWLVAVLVAIAAGTADGEALAGPDEREQCATAAEQAQQLRDDGKYRRAREQMPFCARPSCPGPIKADCGRWLAELDRDSPTVVFGARDSGGGDLLDVKVSMDGTVIQSRLDGKPVLVDAGEHTFRFESSAGVKESRVLIRTGEKSRPLLATFAPSQQPAGKTSKRSSTAGGRRHHANEAARRRRLARCGRRRPRRRGLHAAHEAARRDVRPDACARWARERRAPGAARRGSDGRRRLCRLHGHLLIRGRW